MRAADTNVIVRLLARDDPKQLALAEAEAVRGLWISHIVLLETSWGTGVIVRPQPQGHR